MSKASLFSNEKNNNICDWLLHKMLRKTTFITILIYDYNSMYTISCVIGVRPVLLSNDHRPGAALDKRTGEGGKGGSQYRGFYILFFCVCKRG